MAVSSSLAFGILDRLIFPFYFQSTACNNHVGVGVGVGVLPPLLT